MAFEKKTWLARKSENPTQRKITYADGSSEIVTVEREEGIVSREGDAFSEANMNGLEQRIAEAFVPLDTLEKKKKNTEEEKLAGALAVKALKKTCSDLSTKYSNVSDKYDDLSDSVDELKSYISNDLLGGAS